jgi:hypothetical protein
VSTSPGWPGGHDDRRGLEATLHRLHPSDKDLAEQLIRRAKSYVLVGDKLYRRGASSGGLMKCVPREEGKGILEEIHKGVCGNHASSRTLVSKAFR